MNPRLTWFLLLIILLLVPVSNSLAQGETCATAVNVGGLPFTYSGTTCGSGFDYTITDNPADNPNLCLYPDLPIPGQNTYIEGEDFVFQFTPTVSGCYDFILSSGGGAIHIFDTCPDDPLVSCLGYRRNNIGATVSVNVNIWSGNTVYIVISGQSWWCDDFDLSIEIPASAQVNDFCQNAIELQTTGSNAGATDCGEPDDWAPENYPGVDCIGDSGGWGSNENGVWFTVNVEPTTPQPFFITINNVSCVGGGELLQMGLWIDTGNCTLSQSTFINCAIGIGTVSLGPLNLPPGSYYLFVDGQNGSDCVWEFESELLCDLAISATPTDESCGGMMDGSIAVSSTGGTAPLSYTIDGTPTSLPITGLSAGTYTIGVSDVEGCTDETMVTVGVGPSPTISATPTDESCAGMSDGEIAVVGSGGTPPLSYTIDGSPTSIPITGLSAGTYTIGVMDLNGCADQTVVTVGAGPSPTISATPIDESCAGMSDGEIAVVGSGGTAPLSYTIDGTPTSLPITGLSAGNYTVVVTDINGCSDQSMITVGVGLSPIISATAIDESCSGMMDGAITVSGIGGTPPLSYTLNGSPTSLPITGLGAGTYTIGVADINGCANQTMVSVGAGLSPIISATAIDESCSGMMDGEITVVGSGGTPPLSYTLNGSSTSLPISGLSEGIYTLGVFDINGCSDETMVTIGAPTPMIISCSATGETAPNASDGTATIDISGGTALYDIFWTGPSSGSSIDQAAGPFMITGLAPGNYSVIVVDDNDCTSQCSFMVPPVFCNASATSTLANPINCFGDCTGAINISITDAAMQYTFVWTGPTVIGNVQNPTGLCAGEYSVLITDNNGCDFTTNLTIDEPTELIISCSAIGETAPNASDGSGTIDISGGTALYDISWTGPSSGSSTDQPAGPFVITGLTPGNYSVTVTDDNGCVNQCTFIVQPENCNVSATATLANPINCFGDCTGAINISITDAAMPYTFVWTGPTVIGNVQNPTGLCAGEYSVIITDNNGCDFATNLTINEPTELIISCSATGETAPNASDGTGTIDISGGTALYDISWTGPSSGSSLDQAAGTFVINGLAPGNYSVTVTDENNCTDECMFIVQSENCNASATASLANPINCFGECTGAINLSITDAAMPYTFVWTGPTTIGNVQNPTELCAGEYSVLITDNNGCDFTTNLTIDEPTELIISCSATGETAPNAADGTGTIDITGGTALYDISWTGPSSGSSLDQAAGPFVINGLAPGNYSVTVTDDNNCTDECTFIVQSENCNASAIATLANPINCFGDCTGAINLTISDAAMPYTFVWTGPTVIGNVQNPTGLCAGEYSVIITDSNGCDFTTNLTINEPTELIISCSATGETAPNAADGTGTINISGGTALYDISWTGPSSGSSLDQAAGTFVINGLAPGNYSVIVTDDNNCTDECTFIVQSENCNASATASLANPINCFGDCTGAINLSITDAAMPSTFVWTGPTVIGNVQNPTGLCAGEYSVIITDNNGCDFTTNLTINEPTELIISCSATGETAPNAADGTGTIDISGGTALYDISWTGPSSGSSLDQAAGTFVINGLAPGNYSVTVTDDNNCTDECTFIVQSENCNASAIATLANPINCFGDCTGAINLTISDAAMPYTFVWTGPTVIGNVQNPTGLCAGEYSVLITDSNGCAVSVSLNITEGEAFPIADAGADGDVNCVNSNFSLDGTGSTGAITDYEWSFNNITISTDPITEESQGGIYTLTVTTANGCSATDEAVINIDPSVPTASGGPDQIITCDQTTVMLDGSNSFGDDLLWTGPGIEVANENDAIQIVDQIGTYTLIVTNALGCSAVDMVDVNDGTVVVDVIIQSTENVIDCEITSITLDGTTSQPTIGTVFTWSDLDGPIPGANSGTLLVTQSGTYILTVLDVASGCSDSEEIDIITNTEFPLIEINTPNPITCNNPLSLLDGTGSSIGPNIVYQWFDRSGNIIPGANDITYQASTSGAYILMVTDNSNGCANNIEVMLLADVIPPVADAGDLQSLDCAAFEVELDGSNSSTGTNITYEWSTNNGNLIFGLSDTNPIANAVGEYTIVVTNEDNGCTAEDVVLVDSLDNAPQEVLLSIFDPTCFGDNDGMVLIDEVVGGTPPYEYSFENLSFSSLDQFTNLSAGSYTISVLDAQGCETETSLTITEQNLLGIDVGDDETIQLGESIDLNAIFNIPVNQIDSFSWLNPTTLDCDVCFTTVAQPTETTTYEAIVYDLNGCFALDRVTVKVEKERSVYIPNVFSPNGDGANDLFTIYSGSGVKRINELRVFDRWGENIFAEFNFAPNNPTIGWDGIFNGQPMNPSVYVYWAEVEFEDGVIVLYKGDVTLIR